MQGNQIITLIIVLILLWALLEQKLVTTKEYSVKSARLPKQFDHTKIVVLADLHNKRFGKKNERLIRHIDKLEPDYILVAGDMVNKNSSCYPGNGFDLLEQLSHKHRIFYALGNHEQRLEHDSELDDSRMNHKASAKKMDKQRDFHTTWIEYKELLTAHKVTFLNNESVSIIKGNASVIITGLSIGQEYFERHKQPLLEADSINRMIGKGSSTQFRILIAHNSVYFKSYVKWGADLILSGHLHGGMVRLPGIGGLISPQAKFFPRYQSGLYTEQGKSMIVSRGLGSHSIMPRLFNIPELVSIELISEQKQ